MSGTSLKATFDVFSLMAMRSVIVAASSLLPISVALAAPQDEPKPAAEAIAPEAPTPDQNKTAEEMARTRADLLAKHQGADEARLTQLMGPPAEKAAKESGLTLVWRGPAGGGDPLPCRIAATLVDGGLANIELSGHPSWDRKTCRKFLRPLLQALPWRTVEHPPADPEGNAAALVNETVVQMVRDGVSTQTIIGRVRARSCRFDLSSNATSALRQSGVPDVVIQAMGERHCS
jgi:hypothetical protein